MEAAIKAASLGYDRLKEVKEFEDLKVGVKGLSDSGITSIPRFFVHPPEAQSDLKNSSSSSTSISTPILDLSKLNSPSDRPKLVNQIRDAAKTWGFFQVINHGVPVSVLDDVISSVRAFHDQPFEVKSKYDYKRGEEEERGVRFSGNANLYRPDVAACWHDFVQAWLAPEAAVIPEVCREAVTAWSSHATALAERLMELLAEGLGLESSKFKELSFLEKKAFMGHCYPYCPQPDLTVGGRAHTDPGILAILTQNQVPGLQVKHGDVWVDIKPLQGSLLVNTGDFLQIISNGAYMSVEHRVLANSCKEPRISVVMFFNVAKWKGDGHYGPLPELLSPENPAIYRKFTRKEFLENLYSKAIDSKSLIEKIKIYDD